MRRSAFALLFGIVMCGGVAAATTSVEIETTGERHALGGWLAVRGRYETRSWDLELESITPPSAAIGESLDDMRFSADTSSFGAELLFRLGSHIELRGILAVGEIELDGRRGRARFDLDTDIGLLYGFGARISVPALWPPRWDLNVDFEMLTGSLDNADFYFTGGEPLASIAEADLDWRQISLSPTVSKDLGIITPYAGLRFATADADVTVQTKKATEELSFENEYLLSVVLGARFRLGSFISGDVHVDLLHNEGIVARVTVRF
ncbi:MAG: hypothetical protein JW889_16785 [Verrucomicrobia bacterium]|nr:hypothetical protein [Verrucomicrobiota bacterium]